MVLTPPSSRPIARVALLVATLLSLCSTQLPPPTSRPEARPNHPCPCSAPTDTLPSARCLCCPRTAGWQPFHRCLCPPPLLRPPSLCPPPVPLKSLVLLLLPSLCPSLCPPPLPPVNSLPSASPFCYASCPLPYTLPSPAACVFPLCRALPHCALPPPL